LQSLILGVVELRLTIRFLLRVRGDERKRSLFVVLGISNRGAVSRRRKSYVFGTESEISKNFKPRFREL
ncbi:hypothetical protein LINPERPRIM_LOCUS21049, partial [Linum perenne]